VSTKKGNGNGKIARIGQDAVRTGTGKTWSQWLTILDRAGAGKMSHRDIALLLGRRYPGIGMWWHQMVTVGYEQARGLRETHERIVGYEISGSRTVAASASALFKAWKDPRARRRWLPGERLVIGKTTAGKSMRIVWGDGTTRLEVQFFPRRPGRCQVVVSHSRLKDAKAAQHMKTFWSGRLDRLQEILEA
jgi:uncharacterized protein YndB with AHSA1/START domain